ncbi:14807_t:CDS:1, partial [Racocetra persica]
TPNSPNSFKMNYNSYVDSQALCDEIMNDLSRNTGFTNEMYNENLSCLSNSTNIDIPFYEDTGFTYEMYNENPSCSSNSANIFGLQTFYEEFMDDTPLELTSSPWQDPKNTEFTYEIYNENPLFSSNSANIFGIPTFYDEIMDDTPLELTSSSWQVPGFTYEIYNENPSFSSNSANLFDLHDEPTLSLWQDPQNTGCTYDMYNEEIMDKQVPKNAEYSMKRSTEAKFVFENPSCSPDSPNTDHQALLYEIMKDTAYKFTLPLDELLAPREQRESHNPPRSQNKFILFRKDYTARMRKENPNRTKSMKTRDLSKEASEAWKVQSVQVKQLFTVLADIANERHRVKYPGYVYMPEKK